jgi:hypothetical protein
MAVSTQPCIAAKQGTLRSVGLAQLQGKHCAVDHVGLFGISVLNYFKPYSLAYAVLNDQPGPAGRRLCGSNTDGDEASCCGQLHLHRFLALHAPVF